MTPIAKIKIGPMIKPAWLTAKGIVRDPAPNMIRRRLKYAIQDLEVIITPIRVLRLLLDAKINVYSYEIGTGGFL